MNSENQTTTTTTTKEANTSGTKNNQALNYNVKEFYKGKTVFLTGCTGFLGKVLVEKFLRCLPETKKIYILVRPKKGFKNVQERLHKEVVSSKIMDRLKKEMGKEEFEKFANTKLIAVAGDVEKELVLTNKSDIEKLQDEVNIVIHSAATIGFHERLDNAIRLNTLGALNTLKLSKTFKNMEVFVHISTAYSNSNKKCGSYVQEMIYPLDLPTKEDVEEFCYNVVKMKPEEVKKVSKKMLKHFKFPNTYTFTKNMAERLILRYREHVPVAILRPTIIGSAVKEPVPGWVDAATAAGAVYLSGGIGVLYAVRGNYDSITDHIPVDIVVNSMIVCAVAIATESKAMNNPIHRIFHCGTSSKNPVTWGQAVHSVNKYWQSHKPSKSIAIPHMGFYSNFEYQLRKIILYTIFTRTYQALSSVVHRNSIDRMATFMKKVESRAELMDVTYRYFLTNEWIFDTSQLEELMSHMSKNDNENFFLDVKIIEWFTYFHYFCYGLQKYVLKEDPGNITAVDITRIHSVDWISDITFSYTSTSEFNNSRSRDKLMRIVLLSGRVQNQIQQESEKTSKSFNEVQERAKDIMEKMFADPKPSLIRILAWLFRKIWRIMYQSIVVDDNQISLVKELANNKNNGPLVIIPTHKSYVDFLILTYIFFAYSLPVPHIAADEDFLDNPFVHKLFRHSGAFFVRKKPARDPLYNAIFAVYMGELLKDECPIEFFVEEKRSRDGKTHQASLDILSVITDSYIENQVGNVTILPVSINYEKILEGVAYTNELLGEKKQPETLSGLIKAFTVLKNRHGHIYLKFGEPISMQQYAQDVIEQHQQEGNSFDPYLVQNDKQELVKSLGRKISYGFNETVVCMPTAIIASILLAHREGLSFDELTDKALWLKDVIQERGAQVFWSGKIGVTAEAIIAHALNLINPIVLHHKNMVEPNISKGMERNLIHLAQYRNQIIHVFIEEAIICCAYYSFERKPYSEKLTKRGVTAFGIVDRESLLARAANIRNLFKLEFLFTSQSNNLGDILDLMLKRGILKQLNNAVLSIPSKSEYLAKFLCSFVWPFIEGYWLTYQSLLSLRVMSSDEQVVSSGGNRKSWIQQSILIERVQWFGDKLYGQGKLEYYESISMETIRNAIMILSELDILSRLPLTQSDLEPDNSAEERLPGASLKALASPEKKPTKTYTYEEDFKIEIKTKDPTDVIALVEFLSKFKKPIEQEFQEINDFHLLSKL